MTRKWTKNLENYQKFRNFHGCLRVFLVEYGTQVFIKSYKTLNADEVSYMLSNGTEYTSDTIDFIKIIAEKANFTPYVQLFDFEVDDKLQTHFQTIFYKGKAIYNHEVLFTSSYETYDGFYHISFAYEQYKMLFVVTPGESFSPYEKLLLPFDALTWSFLLSTLLIAFVVIFIVDLMPKVVQSLFYGLGVSSPMLNVISIFFGIAQQKLPFNNFGRIILITFVMVCVVLRNGYQGKKYF
jgi:hypothetical protein